jgi:hypothetical protein
MPVDQGPFGHAGFQPARGKQCFYGNEILRLDKSGFLFLFTYVATTPITNVVAMLGKVVLLSISSRGQVATIVRLTKCLFP